VATFKLAAIAASRQSVGCLGNPAATSTTLVCNEAITATNLDTVLGTTVPNGAVYVPGGGAFRNYFAP
jgi:hypothetical protein